LIEARRRYFAAGAPHSFRLAVGGEEARPHVVLGGDVDIAALPGLRAVLRSLLARRPEEVEIDLTDVDLVETVTAGFLAQQQAAAEAAGTRLVLRGAHNLPARLLSMAGAIID
jgi:anti-anti-sigma factor